ncbi:MAG: hypothetical protein O2822_00845 [Chloroflexi bacterium]|nr:hypothetical protein [Chloroflexota bacterium]
MTRRPSVLGLSASVLASGIAVLYLLLIVQGAVGYEGAEGYVAVVASIFVLQAALTVLGTVRLIMLFTGGLALFSIGVPLMLAGALALGAALRARVSI